MKSWPGEPYPLGATWDGAGVNFALASENAAGVELCLFEGAGGDGESERIRVTEQTNQVWHVYLPDAKPGLVYGYRVYGPYTPQEGHRFNPAKLLLDPYAKAITGDLRWDRSVYGYQIQHKNKSLSQNAEDDAANVPKSVVIDKSFEWGDDKHPRIAWADTVIYECHVKGFTKLLPDVPEEYRGTYAGLASPASIDHLRKLGVTSVELMPVHTFIPDENLLRRGLTNYWGYNTIGFFAPDKRYSGTGEPVSEFKSMVKTLHQEGIEVILDVVYNHTAEGNEMGPTLCFRGVDNAMYYRLMPDKQQFYMDYTGTGNTLNMRHPRTLQLVMDSLRYWVLEMHVDGFRFDLAAALARELHEVDRLSAFFDIISQDPVLSQVKLIAEPWDIGEGGYQVGFFPPGWSEWNGKFRDCIRDFWRGKAETIKEIGYRLTGSADLYEPTGRRPSASINFVTAHDGFSLVDLVSYNDKHNEANGEEGKDGENNNRSWNCGVEGPTDDPAIKSLRERQMRNFVATLFLSQGVPMLLHGDELARSKKGNNNTYCQDNEISWMDWKTIDQDLLDFTRRLIHLRREHPVFRRQLWSRPTYSEQLEIAEIGWLRPDGSQMREADWNGTLTLGLFLNGKKIRSQNPRGERIEDDDFLIILNASHEDVAFTLPGADWGERWQHVLATTTPCFDDGKVYEPGEILNLIGRSLVLLRHG